MKQRIYVGSKVIHIGSQAQGVVVALIGGDSAQVRVHDSLHKEAPGTIWGWPLAQLRPIDAPNERRQLSELPVNRHQLEHSMSECVDVLRGRGRRVEIYTDQAVIDRDADGDGRLDDNPNTGAGSMPGITCIRVYHDPASTGEALSQVFPETSSVFADTDDITVWADRIEDSVDDVLAAMAEEPFVSESSLPDEDEDGGEQSAPEGESAPHGGSLSAEAPEPSADPISPAAEPVPVAEEPQVKTGIATDETVSLTSETTPTKPEAPVPEVETVAPQEETAGTSKGGGF